MPHSRSFQHLLHWVPVSGNFWCLPPIFPSMFRSFPTYIYIIYYISHAFQTTTFQVNATKQKKILLHFQQNCIKLALIWFYYQATNCLRKNQPFCRWPCRCDGVSRQVRQDSLGNSVASVAGSRGEASPSSTVRRLHTHSACFFFGGGR